MNPLQYQEDHTIFQNSSSKLGDVAKNKNGAELYFEDEASRTRSSLMLSLRLSLIS